MGAMPLLRVREEHRAQEGRSYRAGVPAAW